ncbi:MAG: hypothetical protein M3O15_09385 [Acidobacteriota bacterium]|nr:hypothetical protein [Acidobacteriota bacterium]
MNKRKSDPSREVLRVVDHLEMALLRARVSRAEVERRLGWGEGRVTRVLEERASDLKLRQVFEILAVLEVEPAEFWAAVHSTETEWPSALRSQTGLADEPPVPEQRLLEEIRKLIGRVLPDGEGDPPDADPEEPAGGTDGAHRGKPAGGKPRPRRG